LLLRDDFRYHMVLKVKIDNSVIMRLKQKQGIFTSRLINQKLEMTPVRICISHVRFLHSSY